MGIGLFSGSPSTTLDLLYSENSTIQALLLDFRRTFETFKNSKYRRGLVADELSHRLAVRETAKRFLSNALSEKLGRTDLAVAILGNNKDRQELIEKLYRECTRIETEMFDIDWVVMELATAIEPEIIFETDDVLPRIVAEVGNETVAHAICKPSDVLRYASRIYDKDGHWSRRAPFLGRIKSCYIWCLNQTPDPL